jgi:hypothetical protein
MSDFKPKFVDGDLPAGKQQRILKPYAEAALADKAGRWVELPYPADRKGCIVQNLKHFYGLEARSIAGVVYCRRRPA